MTEIQQADVKKDEVKTQEPEKKIDQKLPEQAKVADQAEESPQDRDWKKWRENRQKEREQAARDAEARIKAEKEAAALKAALEAVMNKPTSNHNEYASNDGEETEDQRIERRVNEAILKREAEFERISQEREAQEYPKRLVSTFSDFNQVCSQENMDYLEFHHPELAKSLGARQQSFDKWADVYNAIKRYVPNTNGQKDLKKAEKNLQKPQSMSNSGLAPAGASSSPSRLDEARRAANWERMQRTLKGLS